MPNFLKPEFVIAIVSPGPSHLNPDVGVQVQLYHKVPTTSKALQGLMEFLQEPKALRQRRIYIYKFMHT